jgi:hypothetical protein
MAFGAAAEPSAEMSRLLPTIPSVDHDPNDRLVVGRDRLGAFSPTCQT